MSVRSLSRALAVTALLALGACQTLPQVVTTGRDTFDVRYDAAVTSTADADARAATLCSGAPQFLTSGTRYDGFAFRSYRCQRRP